MKLKLIMALVRDEDSETILDAARQAAHPRRHKFAP